MPRKRMFTFRQPIFSTAHRICFVLCWSVWLSMGHVALAQNRLSGSSTTPASGIQSLGDTLFFDATRSLASQLMPFDSLVQIGLRHSPSVKEDDASIESRLEQYRYTKTVILQFVYPFANYTTGNQILLSAGTLNSFDQYQLTNGYRAGVHVQIPLAELIGRRHRMRGAMADYNMAVAKRDITRQQFRRELVQIYQGMLTAQQVLQIRIRDEKATEVAFQQAELAFQGGKINPDDFARASNLYASAQAGVAEQRGLFAQYLDELQTMVGVPLSDLKR